MHVIYFHSVGNQTSQTFLRNISESLEKFELFCRYLKRKNYKTHFLESWYKNSAENESLKRNNLVLTFDDGYLDNWTYVYPILKRYGLKGTIFVNPEFIEDATTLRRNLEDVRYNKSKISLQECTGFLNWNEIKVMQKSGIIDIQSHSMSHNSYFTGDEVIDIYVGQQKYIWLYWLYYPDKKPYSLNRDKIDRIPYGTPIFRFERALACRKYIPDRDFVNAGIQMYQAGSAKNKIIRELQEYKIIYPGNYETNDEMIARFRYELFESKRIIEEKLGKRVDYLCWPGGGFNEMSLKISIEVGYKASTQGSSVLKREITVPDYYKRIVRFGIGSIIKSSKITYFVENKSYLIYLLKSKTGNYILRFVLKAHRDFIKYIFPVFLSLWRR